DLLACPAPRDLVPVPVIWVGRRHSIGQAACCTIMSGTARVVGEHALGQLPAPLPNGPCRPHARVLLVAQTLRRSPQRRAPEPLPGWTAALSSANIPELYPRAVDRAWRALSRGTQK